MNEYDRIHAERYRLSLEAVRPYLTPGATVLELGGGSPFTAMVQALTGMPMRSLSPNHDLRHPFTAEKCDVVLCMEVLEHINDVERDMPVGWEGTGAKNLLTSALRALKPGGVLFLTTPNACSWRVIAHALYAGAPMHYRPHIREYPPSEVRHALIGAGFTDIALTTCDPWGDKAIHPQQIDAILKAFPHISAKERGEDTFAIAKAP